MADKICLDTDFLVDFLRNDKEAIDFIKEHETSSDLAITYINLFELFYGAQKSTRSKDNMQAVDTLIRRLNILNLGIRSAKNAGKTLAKLEKNGNIVDFRDLLIGSIATENGYSIKTHNKKHFDKIDGLKVI